MGQHYNHLSALERNVLQHQLNFGSSQALIALTATKYQSRRCACIRLAFSIRFRHQKGKAE